jgi:hypothetical protein
MSEEFKENKMNSTNNIDGDNIRKRRKSKTWFRLNTPGESSAESCFWLIHNGLTYQRLNDETKPMLYLKALPYYRELTAGTAKRSTSKGEKIQNEEARIDFEENAPFGADILKKGKK